MEMIAGIVGVPLSAQVAHSLPNILVGAVLHQAGNSPMVRERARLRTIVQNLDVIHEDIHIVEVRVEITWLEQLLHTCGHNRFSDSACRRTADRVESITNASASRSTARTQRAIGIGHTPTKIAAMRKRTSSNSLVTCATAAASPPLDHQEIQ
jgi:hypothetical protein